MLPLEDYTSPHSFVNAGFCCCCCFLLVDFLLFKLFLMVVIWGILPLDIFSLDEDKLCEAEGRS